MSKTGKPEFLIARIFMKKCVPIFRLCLISMGWSDSQIGKLFPLEWLHFLFTGDFAILLNSGLSYKQAIVANFLSACTCYVGMVIGTVLGSTTQIVKWIYAIAAGMFLYISLVDMVSLVLNLSPCLSFDLMNEAHNFVYKWNFRIHLVFERNVVFFKVTFRPSRLGCHIKDVKWLLEWIPKNFNVRCQCQAEVK